MTEELLERIKRIEIIVAKAYKLARLVRRRHNQVTDTFNKNFEVFEENIQRNSNNIDKMVKTLQELVGDAEEYDKEHHDEKINFDSKMIYL